MNRQIIENAYGYDAQDTQRGRQYLRNPREFGFFLSADIVETKGKPKCKNCQQQIFDKYEVITHEGWFPKYHVNCYRELFDLFMRIIQSQKNEVIDVRMATINDGSLNG